MQKQYHMLCVIQSYRYPVAIQMLLPLDCKYRKLHGLTIWLFIIIIIFPILTWINFMACQFWNLMQRSTITPFYMFSMGCTSWQGSHSIKGFCYSLLVHNMITRGIKTQLTNVNHEIRLTWFFCNYWILKP